MADIVIKNLNSRISQSVSGAGIGAGAPAQTGQSFQQILSGKSNDKLIEKLTEMTNSEKLGSQNLTALSGDNITIKNSAASESAGGAANPKKTVSDLFSTINNDSLKMDSIIEVLSSDQTKLSKKQLLAYQASIATLSLNTEMFSKLASSLSQNINTLLQTNMG